MSEKPIIDEGNVEGDEPEASELKTRREFLSGLGRWSAIIIGGAALGSAMATDSAAWINGGGGGGWVNARGGGGGGTWVNRAGGGGGWVNARGGGGGWINRN